MSDGAKTSVVLVGLGAVVALAVGISVVMFLPRPEPADAVAAAPASTDAPAPSETTAEAPDTAEPEGPQFDTFRVEPDGSMVIAGRTDPGQAVAITLADEVLERVTADASGSFVAFPVAGPSETPRRLALVADPDGLRLTSETTYLVAPIAAPAPVSVADAILAPDEPPASDESTSIDALPEPGESPALPEVENAVTPPSVPEAPTVLQADATGVRVVPSSPAVTVPNVAVDAITYDPKGEVQLTGRATGDGAVQIYLDNEPLTTTPIAPGGDWRVDLPNIDTGVYTLRVDELDAEGTVVSRVETPFKREEAQSIAAVLAEETAVDGFEVAVKTVQPGATLWAIAEESFGNGIFYVEVFEANTDLIRDPDLIYPGQIFRLPKIEE